MYQAEIRGKLPSDFENKEDILTSNVFSFLKYAERKLFLLEFLKLVGIDVSVSEAGKAEFIFWPVYEDRTEPDLVLIVGDYYILVEAKLMSGFGQETEKSQHQLVREYQGGKAEAVQFRKEFVLLAITADPFFKPELFTDVPDEIREQIRWVNWQSVTLMLERILANTSWLKKETRDFAQDLSHLLQKKSLRSFVGTESLMFEHELSPMEDHLFFDFSTADYRGVFLGFQTIANIAQIQKPEATHLFFKSQAKLFKRLYKQDEIGSFDKAIFWRK
jgi:hypothetical protein